MVETSLFSLEDETRQAPILSLGDQEPPHSDEFLSGQAAKLHLSLKDRSPGLEEVSSSLRSGNDEVYRRMLADQDEINQIETRNDVLEQILQSDPNQVTPDVVGIVQGLSNVEVRSPDLSDIIERKYSSLYTDTAAASLDNDILDEALEADPEATYEILDRTEKMVYKQNYVYRLLDESKKQIEDQSWGATIYNVAENMFLGRYQTYDQVDEEFVSSILPGGNRLEQYAYLAGIQDIDEFHRVLNQVDEDLKSRNPYTRAQWLQGLISYGGMDAVLENIDAGFDIAGILPIGKLGQAARGIVRGATKNPVRIYEAATDLGKYGDAAVGKVVEDLKDNSFFGQNIRKLNDVENSIPSIMSPGKLLTGSENVPQAAYLRLKESLLERADLAQKFLTEPNLVDRATPEELIEYGDILRRDYVKQNPSIQKNVIDVSVSPEGDLGNVYQAKVILGRRDGTLFESEKQAENYFKRFVKGTDDYQITQRGEGFQIEINKNVDESRFLSDIRLGTTQRTPESLADTFSSTSWIRSPVEQVSEQQRQGRAVAVSSKELLDSVYSRLSEPFRKLSKNEMSELQDLMIDNRSSQKYFETYGDLETAFYSRFKKPPTEAQADTYFSYIQLNDLDLVVRDLSVYKQKARMGVEDIRMKVDGSDIDFEGRVIQNLPYDSSSPFRVGIVENNKLKSTKYSTMMGEDFRESVRKMQDQGFKIVNAIDPEFKIGDRYFDYVIVRDVTQNRIGLKNIERRAGGHKVQKYPYYIKQGRITGDEGTKFYRGDKTFFNFRSQKEADDFLEVLETARVKLLNKEADAVKYLRDNIPIDSKEFLAAVRAGDIDLSVPFTTTKSGMRALDTGAYSKISDLRDATNSQHKPSIMGRYLGERSEADIKTIRSESDRTFSVEAAPYLSPMETLKTATSDMISQRVFDDYALMTRDNFIREFSDILDGSINQLLTQGMAPLHNPVFKQGIEKLHPEKVQRAKNTSRAFNNLMNRGTMVDTKIEAMKEKLLSGIIPKINNRGTQQYFEDKMLSSVRDPGAFWRSAAFNMKLGMFNPIQYFKQANQVVAAVSISGVNGLKSASLYPALRGVLLTNNPKVITRAAEMSEKLGLMKSSEFIESVELFKRSGFNEIGHDLSYIDDLRSPDIRKGAFGRATDKTLHAGATPFREGERVARIVAWNSAYLERKAALKGAKVTRRDEAAILSRAKLLAGNMSREMNAPWQKGYMATVTQFFSYQARIMDMMTGKQLSGAEKARLFLGYSTMYGLPVGVGATVGVFPVRDWLIDYMNENGIDYSNPAAQVAIDGFASEMVKYVFGKDLNIASSYGPGGLPTLYDLLRGDKDISEILLGASGGIAAQTAMDSIPILRGMASEFLDFEGGYYNLTTQDLIKPFRNISSVNSAAQLYEVYNFGIWSSKNGINLAEADLPDALLATMMGLQPAAIEESFSKYRATKAGQEEFKSQQKELIRQYRNAMRVEESTTRDQMIKDIKAQMILKGFTIREMNQTWKYAADSEMMTDVFFENYEKLLERKTRAESGRTSLEGN